MIVQHFLQCTEQNSFINALPYDPRNLIPNGHTWLTVAKSNLILLTKTITQWLMDGSLRKIPKGVYPMTNISRFCILPTFDPFNLVP